MKRLLKYFKKCPHNWKILKEHRYTIKDVDFTSKAFIIIFQCKDCYKKKIIYGDNGDNMFQRLYPKRKL